MKRTHESLPELLHDIARHAPNGLKAEQVAERLGKPYSTLMNELNSAIESHKFSVALLIPLMQVVGSDAPAHYIAGAMGGVFLPLPTAENDCNAVQEQALVTVKEFGEFIAEISASLLDGDLSDNDKSRIRKEGYESLQAISALMQLTEGGN
ncbi:phage regulatory CII family protein [Halodesulfovibrio aestuarii]|uniref:Phage regulatory CII family protein n=1 Tax=Halodesulfovibrio aestuarii TaxID=126333 RepID=A0ABV4JTW1_9BACT